MNKMWSLISDSNRGIHSLAAGHLLSFNLWRFLFILWPELLLGLKKICWGFLKIRSNLKFFEPINSEKFILRRKRTFHLHRNQLQYTKNGPKNHCSIILIIGDRPRGQVVMFSRSTLAAESFTGSDRSLFSSRDKLEINIEKFFSWGCISSNDFYHLVVLLYCRTLFRN